MWPSRCFGFLRLSHRGLQLVSVFSQTVDIPMNVLVFTLYAEVGVGNKIILVGVWKVSYELLPDWACQVESVSSVQFNVMESLLHQV